jgi:hypothetical protein
MGRDGERQIGARRCALADHCGEDWRRPAEPLPVQRYKEAVRSFERAAAQ